MAGGKRRTDWEFYRNLDDTIFYLLFPDPPRTHRWRSDYMRQGLKITEDEFEKASKEYRSLAQQIYDGIPSKLDRTEQARRLKEKLDSYLIWRDLAKNLPAELDTSKWFDTLKHAFAFRYVDNRAKATHNRTRSDSPPSPSPSISPGRRPASQLERPEQLESVMKKKKKAIISAPSNGRSLLTENASRISNLEDYNNQPVSDLGLSEFIQPPDESINSDTTRQQSSRASNATVPWVHEAESSGMDSVHGPVPKSENDGNVAEDMEGRRIATERTPDGVPHVASLRDEDPYVEAALAPQDTLINWYYVIQQENCNLKREAAKWDKEKRQVELLRDEIADLKQQLAVEKKSVEKLLHENAELIAEAYKLKKKDELRTPAPSFEKAEYPMWNKPSEADLEMGKR